MGRSSTEGGKSIGTTWYSADDSRTASDLRKSMCWYATRVGHRSASTDVRTGAAVSTKAHGLKADDGGGVAEGCSMSHSSNIDVAKMRK